MMNDSNALKTDLYELTMAAGYFQNNLKLRAVFELYCHTLPPCRSFLIACGLERIVEYLLNLRFSDKDIEFLRAQSVFGLVSPRFFEYLKNFQFTGNLWALPEGEICFAGEPILQVEAPIIEAQILETYLLSIINISTLVATKAARVVLAAQSDGGNRTAVDFGSRRAHGPQAGILAARSSYIGGCLGTSNVFAGRQFQIPIFGTMAHSFVEAFPTEKEAFEKYQAVFPANTILLIDTYDTLKGVKKAIQLGKEMKGVRIDSGNLRILSQKVRGILDRHNLGQVKIVASGNLNEYKIWDLVKTHAPIDVFGVGTDMVVSRDVPALDLTYKLVQTQDIQGTISYKAKLSQGKHTVPGRKQVFRFFDKREKMIKDRIGLFTERPPANSLPLLKPILKEGRPCSSMPSLEKIRQKVQDGLASIPKKFKDILRVHKYPVEYSSQILHLKDRIKKV